jgi:hypothetical protein
MEPNCGANHEKSYVLATFEADRFHFIGTMVDKFATHCETPEKALISALLRTRGILACKAADRATLGQEPI